MKINGIASSVMKDNTSTFNVSWLFKVLATTSSFSKKNLWLLDFATDVYICNNQSIFLDFVGGIIALSGVTAQRVLPGWKIVILLLTQKDKQLEA